MSSSMTNSCRESELQGQVRFKSRSPPPLLGLQDLPSLSFALRSTRMRYFSAVILSLGLAATVLGSDWSLSSRFRLGARYAEANSPSSNAYLDLYEASIHDLQSGLESGHFTSVDLVKVRLNFLLIWGPRNAVHRLAYVDWREFYC